MTVHERRDDFAAAEAVACGEVRLQQKCAIRLHRHSSDLLGGLDVVRPSIDRDMRLPWRSPRDVARLQVSTRSDLTLLMLATGCQVCTTLHSECY